MLAEDLKSCLRSRPPRFSQSSDFLANLPMGSVVTRPTFFLVTRPTFFLALWRTYDVGSLLSEMDDERRHLEHKTQEHDIERINKTTS